MAPLNLFEWIVLSLRLLAGVLFLVSGGMKGLTPGGVSAFAADVANYRMLDEPWTVAVAYFLPWLEMVVGGCLLGGVLLRGAILLSLAMTLAFIVAIGQAWQRGLDISCGCFGKAEVAVNYPLHMAGLLLLLAALFTVYVRERRPGAIV